MAVVESQVIEQFRTGVDLSAETIDVSLLDRVVTIMNSGSGSAQQQASELLTAFKCDARAWTKVDAIFEYSQQVETKYFALQILEELIKTRWKSLPREQCEGIKGYVVSKVLELSKEKVEDERLKLLLKKLNLVLVQIVKFEWPRHWPTFITDIVGSSRSSASICMNNLEILRLLSEEVFDYEANLITAKVEYLKNQFCGQFRAVHELCLEILQSADDAALVQQTLRTMHAFLSWAPVGFIFENNLIELITERFLPLPQFRPVAIRCLMEISAIENTDNQYNTRLDVMFKNVVHVCQEQLPEEVDIPSAYAAGSTEQQEFISNLAQFFTTYMRKHATLCEVLDDAGWDAGRQATRSAHEAALKYLLKISQIDDTEVFKICLDFWNALCAELFRESPFEIQSSLMESLRRLRDTQSTELPRRRFYSPFLSQLRMLIISKMAKPEEVIVVVNENNEAVRELVKDTDSIVLYKTMRETLVFLTHLDYRDTETKMIEKLQNQVNGSEWSWKNLNTLCWAIGSISGAMHEEDERRFLVTVIRDLLGLCEQKRGKNNKAVIASNIMYVVGQYPRFLRAHWRFLKTVINKLFEFMHESHEGVQDMACDTFIKIVVKCKSHFTIVQISETQPFIDEILMNLSTIICDLSQPQVHVFYEAVGHIISADHDATSQARLIENLMVVPNGIWADIIQHASENGNVLMDIDVLKNLIHILKTNVAACKSIGAAFFTQIQHIFDDMLAFYKLISSHITSLIAKEGADVLKQPGLKLMRSVKREVLTLLSTWVARADVNGGDRRRMQNFGRSSVQETIAQVVIPPLLDTILRDYSSSIPEAREPKVLSLLSITVVSLKENFVNHLEQMFELVFVPTLSMIETETSLFPEHRINFFQMLDSTVRTCFDVLMRFPEDLVTLIVKTTFFAFKHTIRSVAEIGITLVTEILDRIRRFPNNEERQRFYQRYYMEILTHVVGLVTDHNQVPFVGLANLSEAVCQLFASAETDITVPLNPQNPNQSNSDFVFETIGNLLNVHFPNLTEDQIRVTIKGFFSYNRVPSKMRDHIRDFLVQIKEDAGSDTADLFLEEKEKEIQRVQQEKALVPGIQNPHDVNDEDMS